MEARDLLWCDFKPLRTLRAAVGTANAAALRSITIDMASISISEGLGGQFYKVMRDVYQEGVAAANLGSAQELTLKVDVTPGHWQTACDRCFAVQIKLRAASASLEEAKGVLAQEIEDPMWEVRTPLPHTSRCVAVGDKILHLLKIWKSLAEVWRSLAEEVEHEA